MIYIYSVLCSTCGVNFTAIFNFLFACRVSENKMTKSNIEHEEGAAIRKIYFQTETGFSSCMW